MVEPEHLLLLHAILEKNDSTALDYFTRWSRSIDNMNNVDGGSFHLLPLLYKKLSSIAEPIPYLKQLKGIYRLSLIRNSLLFHKAFSIFEELKKIDVPVIMIKSGALAAAYYEDVGAKMMSDVDFLVREEDFEKTLRFLKERGWYSKYGWLLNRPAKFIHSLCLTNSEGFDLDVHWRAFYQCPWDSADLALWDHTEKVVFQGETIRILNTTQQMLHNCAQGVPWNAVPSIHWIVDVMKILEKRSGSINWAFLISESSARNLSLTMWHTLNFLNSEFHADISDEVLESLKQLPKDIREIRLFDILTSPTGFGNNLRKKWIIHSFGMGRVSNTKKLLLFTDFLRKDFYQKPAYLRERIKKWFIS